MNLRQEKTSEFFVQHMDTFRKLSITDPFFVIKTAFFQKGKYGRQVQFFEWELKKDEDIYVEFYDNVFDLNGTVVNYKPFHEDRLLCKYRVNPHFAEEYEKKENINQKTGEPYFTYTIPLAEMIAVSKEGREMAYTAYEKGTVLPNKEDLEMPRLQNSLVFPDFEEEYPKKESVSNFSLENIPVTSKEDENPNALLTEMTIKDFAAIILMKPLSNRPWLNDIIKQTKSEL